MKHIDRFDICGLAFTALLAGVLLAVGASHRVAMMWSAALICLSGLLS